MKSNNKVVKTLKTTHKTNNNKYNKVKISKSKVNIYKETLISKFKVPDMKPL